jgi:hypothetical protein
MSLLCAERQFMQSYFPWERAAQEACKERLGFERDDPGADAVQVARAAADVGADIEDEIAGLDELGVESALAQRSVRTPVIYDERSRQPENLRER